MDTQMVDQEPHRSVQLIRRVDTRIPTPLLSASLPSPSPSPAVLGKLAELRAPKPVSSVTSGSGVWCGPNLNQGLQMQAGGGRQLSHAGPEFEFFAVGSMLCGQNEMAGNEVSNRLNSRQVG